MPKPKLSDAELAQLNWLRASDEGKLVLVTGHYSGDFIGTVKYGGTRLAIITDCDGHDRTICYMKPVRFDVIEPEVKQLIEMLPPRPKIVDDDDVSF